MIYKSIFSNFLFRFFILSLIVFCLLITIRAQRISILTPEKTVQSEFFAKNLEKNLSEKFKILDNSLSISAFNSVIYEKPFNLSLKESQNIGAAIGCDYFLLVKSKTLRRYSLQKKEFYESFAAVYVVSSRSGSLILWKLFKGESKDAKEAENLLFDSAKNSHLEISNKIIEAEKTEMNEKSVINLEELPVENSPEAKNFRPPLPYKRVRPNYTEIANLYSIEATIDVLLDVDENGKILRVEISRWAGFGLVESVTKTVTEMNWRPASRNGKTLPIRVLLRYNFKKLDEE